MLPSRKSVKKAIDNQEIFVNGQAEKTGFWLEGGETIIYKKKSRKPPKPYHFKIDVIYEDDDVAVVNKPAGLITSGNQYKTLLNTLSFNLSKSKASDALEWPLPTHRLDKATSGLVLIAKTKKSRIKLGQDFENKLIDKEYHAIVMGKLPDSGLIDDPIDNKDSLSLFCSLECVESLKSEFLTLVKLVPKTGRTHQLRIHLANRGNSILGDSLYGPKNSTLKHKGLFLSSTQISFTHPTKKTPLKIEAPYPKKFDKRMENEKKRWNKYRTV